MSPIRAVARRAGHFQHRVTVRGHEVSVDEPEERGGGDAGPTPQEMLAVSLASCTAVTMLMYAGRKGWDLGDLEVSCEYSPAERGAPTRFRLILGLPETLDEEQIDRLRTIAARCPVHRTLEGEAMFDERVELRATGR